MDFDAASRRALVKQVRAQFRPHFFSRCLELSYRIIPCCKTCEHNRCGKCHAPNFPGSDWIPHNVAWFTVKSLDNLCIQWSPSVQAVITALQYAYKDALLMPQIDPQKNASTYTKEELDAQICDFLSGKISAAEAADLLGIATGTFYAKVREFQNGPIRRPSTYTKEELDEQICDFLSGKISAAEAADSLGISAGSFYAKVRKARNVNDTGKHRLCHDTKAVEDPRRDPAQLPVTVPSI